MPNSFTGIPSLKNGEGGTVMIVGVEGKLHRRLIEMGLTPGARVFVTKRAPLGDPIEIRLRGYELTLRADDAAKILVLPDNAR